jgi:hypothetical protein
MPLLLKESVVTKEIPPETNRGTEQGLIVFKCEADAFKKFISSLLGKPQTIGKARRGCFDIGLREIQDLHLLINQRISQQNESTLIQFTSLIVFEDGSSVLLNSFDDLLAYKEVRPVASTQIHLTWEYLVNFQDRSVPEKQEIEVSFLTSGS